MKTKQTATEPIGGEREVFVRLPVKTIGLVAASLVFFYAFYLLLPLFMVIFLAVLLAVTIEPLVSSMSRWIGRTWAVATVAITLALAFALSCLWIVPELIRQLGTVVKELPQYAEKLSSQLPLLKRLFDSFPQQVQSADAAQFSPVLGQLAKLGGLAFDGISSAALMFVFMIYLLFDGARAFAWIQAFFSAANREKIKATADGVAPVIRAYVVGQIITSVLCAVYTTITLAWIGVPAALLLGLMAGVFDVLPVIGVFLFSVPAVLLALTVSLDAMLLTIGLITTYQLAESYLITPFVYGNRLRVSGLVVLSALLAAGALGGIMGIIAILPIVASYPVVEKIWLARFLGREVLSRHEKVAQSRAS